MEINLLNKNEKDLEGEFLSFIEGNKKFLSTKFFNIDFGLLKEHSPALSTEFEEKPVETIKFLERILEKRFIHEIKIIISNYGNLKYVHNIKNKDIGKMFTFKGLVKKITKVFIRTTDIKFECGSCGTEIQIPQPSKKRKVPERCSCGSRKNFTEVGTIDDDVQELNLETSDANNSQQIRVLLKGDQTGILQAGRTIELIGLVDKLPTFMTQHDQKLNITDFMVFAHSFINLDDEEDLDISEEDEERIREIAYSENPLEKLANSLAPDVYGNQIVKEALVLQAIRPVEKLKNENEVIHVLLCGDVGIAKSKTLFSALERTPGSGMVVGTKTSKVGLGMMVSKDELSGEWSLEAGALVLSSGSTLGIDELDKMYPDTRNELVEPMSAGFVTTTKAQFKGVSLPAKTAVLASANPVGGNYDRMKPLAAQIDLSTEILNRFNLVFILLDKRDEDSDASTVDFILGKHENKIEPEISVELFKKYIIYARKLKPKLSSELNNYLKEFYVLMRRSTPANKAIPVNPRTVETMIRLSEAHAKLRLSSKVELKDFEEAKRIYTESLKLSMDESGMIDTSFTTQKTPFSKRGKMESFLNVLNEMAEDLKKENEDYMIPYKDILERAINKSGMKKWEVGIFLDQLKRETKIFEPQKGSYRILE